MKDGTRGLGRVDTAVGSVRIPIQSFQEKVLLLAGNFGIAVLFFKGLIEFVTTASFCYFQSGQVLEYERMKELTLTLTNVINVASSLLVALKSSLSPLDRFQSLMNSGLFSVFRNFNGILNVFDPLANALSFVITLADFKLCFPVPYFRRCDKRISFGFGSITIPWFCAGFNTKCFGLSDIGNVLRKIENFIKSIPIVGSVWSLVENTVKSIVQSLFKNIGIQIPSFGINTGFLDDVTSRLSDAVDRITDFLGSFSGIDIVGLPIASLLEDSFLRIWDSLPTNLIEAVFDLLVNCTDSCELKFLDLEIIDEDIFPDFKLSGQSFSLPRETLDTVRGFFDQIGDIEQDLENLLDGGFSCGSYEKKKVDVSYMLDILGVNATEVGLPDCPYYVDFCSDFNFDGEALQKFTNSALERLESSFSRRGRKLADSCSDGGFGITIPIPVDRLILKIQNMIDVLIRNPLSKYPFTYWDGIRRGKRFKLELPNRNGDTFPFFKASLPFGQPQFILVSSPVAFVYITHTSCSFVSGPHCDILTYSCRDVLRENSNFTSNGEDGLKLNSMRQF